MAAENQRLPAELITRILERASLDIDTRLELRVRPGRLTEEQSYEHVRERLRATHSRRAEAWKRYEACRRLADGSGAALEWIDTPPIATGTRRSMKISIIVWGPDIFDLDVRMSIEAVETVEDDPLDALAHLLPPGGGEAFVRRGTYCRVHSGEECPKIIDDEYDDDDEDEDYW